MRKQLTSAAIFTTFLATVGVCAAGGPALDQGSDSTAASRIIVRLSEYQGSARELGISATQLERMRGAAGMRLARFRAMSGNARVLSLPKEFSQGEAAAIAARIAAVPGVDYAVVDRIMHPMLLDDFAATPTFPNDPGFLEQWHYYEPTAGIDLPGAWKFTSGDPSVHVAVVDTGIRGDHEDLVGQWQGGYDFINMPFNGRDGDGRDADPTDPGDYFGGYGSSWHGTHVSGTIGAATNNGIGVSGIAHGATIQPVRVLGPLGGFTSDIVDAIRWASGSTITGVPDNPDPARVLNLSLGGGGACDQVWQDAIDDVVAAGSVMVVAAGNETDNAALYSPAGCDGVITVGAVDRTGDLAWYSNYGSTVEISAPGGDTTTPTDGVLSTLDSGTTTPAGDTYEFYQGTSMATPHVAGVVALMFSVNPNLTPAKVLSILKLSAKDFPAGSSCSADATLCGAGILNAFRAVAVANHLAGL